jgi:cysteinyl-tRNA synthetase
LEFDRIVWQAQQGPENEAGVVQARDTMRDMIVLLGNQLAASPGLREERLAPLVEALLGLRQKLRREKQWAAADMLRDALDTVNIVVEDTPDGHRWYLRSG